MQTGLETQASLQVETYQQICHQVREGTHSESLSAYPAYERSTTVALHESPLIDVVFAMSVPDAIYAA